MAGDVVVARIYIAVDVDRCPRCRRGISQTAMGELEGVATTVCPHCEAVLRVTEVEVPVIDEDDDGE